MMEGEKMESQQKGYFWCWNVFLPSEYWLSLYLKRLLELFFFFPFFLFFNNFSLSSFFMLHLLRTWGVLMTFEEKIHFFKNFLFKWNDMEWNGHDCWYTDRERIFWNGVMHANIAKPWLWRCVSSGYIGSGCIFRSKGMHANISGWG
jgi:hypothetical protein